MWNFIVNNPFLKSVIIFLVTILFCGCATLIFLPFISIILIWRWLVRWAAKLFRKPKLGKLVTSTSTVFASGYIYTRKAANIVVIAEIDSPTLDLNKFRTHCETELLSATLPNSDELLYPELKSTVVSWMGFLFWAPCPNFDIKDHVKSLTEIDAPPFHPEDPTSQTRLITYLTRDRIWKENKPLWEFILVENATFSEGENNKSLICLRCHHSVADGWSLFKVIMKLFGNPNMLSKVPQFRPTPNSGWEAFVVGALLWINLPFVTVGHLLTVLSNRTKIPEFKTKSSPLDGPDMYGVMEEVLSLDQFKQLKNRLGIDFHSMIVAGIASAVRKSYQAAGQKVPKNVRIAFPLPMPNHPDKLRNHVSVGTILLPIGEADSLKRSRMISSRIQTVVKSGLPLSTFYLIRLFGCMPHAILRRFRRRVPIPPVLFTNVVGISEPLYWEENRISDVYFSLNMPREEPEGLAYGIGLVTYCGRTKFGVGGLKNAFPNLESAQKFLDWCVAEWRYLETLDINETEMDILQNI